MCPKDEEGLSRPMVSLFVSHSSVTLIPGPMSPSTHSGTFALSTLTFSQPCKFGTVGWDGPTSCLHTSPFFPSVPPCSPPRSQPAFGSPSEACWESGGNVEHLARAQASLVGSH